MDQRIALQETLYTSVNSIRRWLHCQRRDGITWAIESVSILNSRTALEVRPGAGGCITLLLDVATTVVATDCDSLYLDHVRERFKDLSAFVCMVDDLQQSNFPDAHVDLILCTEVIEHIPDVSAALENFCRLLMLAGRIIFSTPQRYSPFELCSKIAYLPGVI